MSTNNERPTPRTDSEIENPQPTYKDLWDAFVKGAMEARENPDARLKDFNLAADAYCKLIHSTKAPAYFAKLATPRSDKQPPVYEGFDSCVSREFARQLERELIVSVNAMVETTDKLIELTAERDAYKASYEDLAATFH